MPDKLLSEITDADIRAAWQRLEDALIEFRDMRVSVPPGACGHGLVVREADGRDSSVIRLRTTEAIRLAVKAMLEAAGGCINAHPKEA
jgi:hypothetical protein